MLRDYSGPVAEGDTPFTLDEIVGVVIYDAQNYKTQLLRERSDSENAKLIATLRNQINTLQAQVQEQKHYIDDQDAQMTALRNEIHYG